MATPTPFHVWADVNEIANGKVIVSLYKQQAERGPVTRVAMRVFSDRGRHGIPALDDRIVAAGSWARSRVAALQRGLYAHVVEEES